MMPLPKIILRCAVNTRHSKARSQRAFVHHHCLGFQQSLKWLQLQSGKACELSNNPRKTCLYHIEVRFKTGRELFLVLVPVVYNSVHTRHVSLRTTFEASCLTLVTNQCHRARFLFAQASLDSTKSLNVPVHPPTYTLQRAARHFIRPASKRKRFPWSQTNKSA